MPEEVKHEAMPQEEQAVVGSEDVQEEIPTGAQGPVSGEPSEAVPEPSPECESAGPGASNVD
jgi:hypothetical protein